MKEEKELVPFRQRISCSIPEAVEATNLSRSSIYNRMAEGKLESRKQGKRRLVLIPSLLKLIEGEGA